MNTSNQGRDVPRPFAVIVLGAFIALFGIVMIIGGVWLIGVGGSFYYLPAGAALLASGALLIRRRLLSVWIYFGFFAITLAWSFWEVGLDGWALVARLTAFTVLLALVVLAWPVLLPGPRNWKRAIVGVPTVLIASAVLAMVVVQHGRSTASAIPEPHRAIAEAAQASVGEDWPAYGGTYSARRFSPLSEVTRENVRSLRRAWVAHTGDLPKTKAAKQMYGAETTPLKIGDALYLCSAKNILIALDPATGKERWRHDPQVSDEAIPYTAACRGVTYFAVPDSEPDAECATRIIEGTVEGVSKMYQCWQRGVPAEVAG